MPHNSHTDTNHLAPQLPDVTAVERLHLAPDEKLVIHVSADVDREQALHTRDQFAAWLGITKERISVLAGNVRLEAVTVEDTDAQ